MSLNKDNEIKSIECEELVKVDARRVFYIDVPDEITTEEVRQFIVDTMQRKKVEQEKIGIEEEMQWLKKVTYGPFTKKCDLQLEDAIRPQLPEYYSPVLNVSDIEIEDTNGMGDLKEGVDFEVYSNALHLKRPFLKVKVTVPNIIIHSCDYCEITTGDEARINCGVGCTIKCGDKCEILCRANTQILAGYGCTMGRFEFNDLIVLTANCTTTTKDGSGFFVNSVEFVNTFNFDEQYKNEILNTFKEVIDGRYVGGLFSKKPINEILGK